MNSANQQKTTPNKTKTRKKKPQFNWDTVNVDVNIPDIVSLIVLVLWKAHSPRSVLENKAKVEGINKVAGDLRISRPCHHLTQWSCSKGLLSK